MLISRWCYNAIIKKREDDSRNGWKEKKEEGIITDAIVSAARCCQRKTGVFCVFYSFSVCTV